jgi:hypothetical protein
MQGRRNDRMVEVCGMTGWSVCRDDRIREFQGRHKEITIVNNKI